MEFQRCWMCSDRPWTQQKPHIAWSGCSTPDLWIQWLRWIKWWRNIPQDRHLQILKIQHCQRAFIFHGAAGPYFKSSSSMRCLIRFRWVNSNRPISWSLFRRWWVIHSTNNRYGGEDLSSRTLLHDGTLFIYDKSLSTSCDPFRMGWCSSEVYIKECCLDRRPICIGSGAMYFEWSSGKCPELIPLLNWGVCVM